MSRPRGRWVKSASRRADAPLLASWAIAAVLVGAAAAAHPANAQREYVEELDAPPPKKSSLDALDLDGPDPALAKKPKPKPATTPVPAPVLPPKKPAPALAPAVPAPAALPTTQPAGAGQAPVAPAGAAVDGPEDTAIERAIVRPTSYAAYLEKWEPRALTVRKGELARARRLLPDLDDAMLEFGVAGIPGGIASQGAALALLLEGKRALEDARLDEAQAVIETAERAAPDLPTVHTEQALLLWRTGDVGGAGNALARAAVALAHDPVSLAVVGSALCLAAAAVLVLLLVVFALCGGVPVLRYLAFDLTSVLPKGAHPGQLLALVLLVALVPALLGAGPALSALCVLSLAWLYLPRRTQAVVAVLGVLAVGLPPLLTVTARLAAFPGSPAAEAARALFDVDAERARDAIRAQPEADRDPLAVAALGYEAKRNGDLPAARAAFEGVLKRAPGAAWASGELGVIAALEQRDDDALRLLGQAVASDPTLYAAAFDISVLHHMNGRTDKAVAAAQPVAAGASDLLAHYRRATFRAPDAAVTHNRAFVDVLPHAGAVLEAGLAPTPDAAAMAAALAETFLAGQAGERAMGVLGFFLVLWAVLFGMKGRLAPATACARCGAPASRRVDGKDVPVDSCAQCFHVFVSTKSRIDGSAKALKEREIARRNRREARVVRLLGVCVPGAGHVYAGAPARGALFLVGAAAAVTGLALAMGLLPLPHPPGPWSQTPALAVAGGALAVVWLVAVRSAFALAAERR